MYLTITGNESFLKHLLFRGEVSTIIVSLSVVSDMPAAIHAYK
jgi:hypothetical protein